MKRAVTNIICVLVGVILGVAGLFSLLRFTPAGEKMMPGEDVVTISHDAGSDELTMLAFQVAGCIQRGDYADLAAFVHPDYGVVISPYATVNLSSNKCFTPNQVSGFGREKTVYIWGVTDVVGEPIEMKPSDYFKQYVADRDYTKAPMVGVDTVVRSGNAMENVMTVFPDARFVDLNYPGDDSSGWATLRLVFEEYEGHLMLTAIIHSEARM